MAIIPVPAKFSFTGIPNFTLMRRGVTLPSKYTGQAQRVIFPFAVWRLEGNLLAYDGLEAGRVRSFLAQLDGIKNDFRLPVPGFTKPLTGNISNYTSYGDGSAPLRGTTILQMAAAPAAVFGNGVKILSEGDFFTIGDELKMVTADVLGVGTDVLSNISFKPALRKAYLNGTPITFQNPTILMHAEDDDIANISLEPPVRQGVPNFAAIESVNIV